MAKIKAISPRDGYYTYKKELVGKEVVQCEELPSMLTSDLRFKCIQLQFREDIPVGRGRFLHNTSYSFGGVELEDVF